MSSRAEGGRGQRGCVGKHNLIETPPKPGWQCGGSGWARCRWGGARRCVGPAAENQRGCSGVRWSFPGRDAYLAVGWQHSMRRTVQVWKLLAKGLWAGSRGESQAVSRLMHLVLHCATRAACRNATSACPAHSFPFFPEIQTGKSPAFFFSWGFIFLSPGFPKK